MARAKKEDPKKENDKAVKSNGQQPEAAVQTENAAQQPEGTAQQPETAEQTDANDQEQDMFAKLPNPCVYCGPSVKGVARQYTTYQGGITDALREFVEKCPEALGLIVSTGRFQTMRRQLEKPGTPEAELYKEIKERI